MVRVTAVVALVIFCVVTCDAWGSKERSLYDILGVSNRASAKEIKSSYRRLALKYHPDHNRDPSARPVFEEIQKAYDVLKDDKAREEYDRFGIIPGEKATDPHEQQYQEYMRRTDIQSSTPVFTMEMLNGLRSGDGSGQHERSWWLVNVYHHYCTSCRMFMGHWDNMVDAVKGIASLGRIHLERDQAVANEFGVNNVPAIVLVSPDGEDVYYYKGELRSDAIVAFLMSKVPSVAKLTGPVEDFLRQDFFKTHVLVEQTIHDIVSLAVATSYPDIVVNIVQSNNQWFRSTCGHTSPRNCIVVVHCGELRSVLSLRNPHDRTAALNHVKKFMYTSYPEITRTSFHRLCNRDVGENVKDYCLVKVVDKKTAAPEQNADVPQGKVGEDIQLGWIQSAEYPEFETYFGAGAQWVLISTKFSGRFCTITEKTLTNVEQVSSHCMSKKRIAIHHDEGFRFMKRSSLWKTVTSYAYTLFNNPFSPVFFFVMVYVVKGYFQGEGTTSSSSSSQQRSQAPRPPPRPQQPQQQAQPTTTVLQHHLAAANNSSVLIVILHRDLVISPLIRNDPKFTFVYVKGEWDDKWVQRVLPDASSQKPPCLAVNRKRMKASIPPRELWGSSSMEKWFEKILDGQVSWDVEVVPV